MPAAAVSCARRARSPRCSGVKPEDVRVVAYDIGGNFGTKNSIFPEFPLVLWASKRVGRPVKWVCERSEAFLSDYQGRDLVAKVELALDKRGHFLAMRGSHLSNIGGYSLVDRAAAQGREHLLGRLSRAGRVLPGLRGAQQHACRRFRIAAPAARRRCSSWSGCAISRRSRPASTASRSGGAI